MGKYSRRELAVLGAGLLGRARAAEPSYAEQYPHMLVTHVANLVNRQADRWDKERNKLSTPDEVEARNRFVRAKAIDLMHGFPERSDLSPSIVNTLERDGYRIEVVLFQSRPNFWVPGSLYIPASGGGPFPGIISPCGHSANGRLSRAYQALYIDLAKSGFVVLAYDPIGQGERRQHWNPATRRNALPGPVTEEHFLSGELLLLIGEDLSNYRIWDGMRAVDYLLTRREVDPKRIGCTGQSGGGTLTLFISALDERIKCAAVHEGGTTHRWPVRFGAASRLGTGDTEQHIFRSGLYGIDLCDLHAAIAPRPLMATIEHYSPGFDATAAHIRRRYEQLGVVDRFATEQATDPHGMTVKLRLAATDWFCRWFHGRRGPTEEPELQLERDETLYATPGGSLRYAQQGDTIFSLILKKQAKLPPDKGAARPEEIRQLIRFRREEGTLGVRQILVTERKGYRIEKVEFISESGIYVPAWVYVPDKLLEGQPAIVYIGDVGVQRDGLEWGPLEGLARSGRLVVAADVRGIGATAPSQPGDAEETLQYLLWEVDESLVGMRVLDVIRTVDYSLRRPEADHARVHLIGKGRGAVWALYAAALDPRIGRVVCDGGLLSYGSLAASDRYRRVPDLMVIDVLKYFDLPQVAAAAAGRDVTLLAPVGPDGTPVDLEVANRVCQPTREAWAQVRGRGSSRFRIVARDADAPPAAQYLQLLSAP